MMRKIDNSPSFSFSLRAGGTAMCAARFPPLREGNPDVCHFEQA